MKILLIEDEKLHYKTFCSLLEDAEVDNFELSWVKTSQDALIALERKTFDLIFMDISLKGSTLNVLYPTVFTGPALARATSMVFWTTRQFFCLKKALNLFKPLLKTEYCGYP